MELIKLDLSNKNEVKDFFREVFTKDPWNDDQSDEEQLDNYIDELCVKTELQGQGIGGKFVNAVEEYLMKNDIRAVFLLTDKSVPAYDFYKKQGFKEQENSAAFAKRLQSFGQGIFQVKEYFNKSHPSGSYFLQGF